MGLRFRKSIKICKGVRMNLSGSGIGLSVGGKGFRYSVNSRGRRTTTVGIPGTGISYSTSSGGAKRRGTSNRSYNSSAYQRKQEIQRQKALLEQQKQNELQLNRLKVEKFENYLDVIRSVHKECEPEISWNSIYNQPPPFELGNIGPKELNATNLYNSFTPTLLEKIFKKKGEKRKKKLYDDISISHNKDEEDYQNWISEHEFAELIINGNIDAYLEAINEVNPFEDFSDYGSDFEFGTDNASYIEIEFKVKSKEVVPNNNLSLTKTGKLSEKAMSKTMYYDITQDYVCSCAIRLAREMFSLLPVKSVLVHAVDEILDTSTGYETDATILSVLFNRDGFENINFDRIDASDFVSTFEMKMKFAKTAGFKPVDRIMLDR